jgi:glycosyltransferase involved in cell wall biosynthesis
MKTPIEVIFEGVDTNIYKYLEVPNKKNRQPRFNSEDFCYLFLGHWLPGDLGEDRKNVGLLIKAFIETFKIKKVKPALF